MIRRQNLRGVGWHTVGVLWCPRIVPGSNFVQHRSRELRQRNKPRVIVHAFRFKHTMIKCLALILRNIPPHLTYIAIIGNSGTGVE